MADEAEHLLDKSSPIPPEYSWSSLRRLDGVESEQHYNSTLSHLGRGPGLVVAIFRKAPTTS